MRTPTDMPQRRRLSRGRLALIVIVAVLFALLVILSFVFGRYEAGPDQDSPGSP